MVRFLGQRRFGLAYKPYFAEDVRVSCFTLDGKVTQLQSTLFFNITSVCLDSGHKVWKKELDFAPISTLIE